MLPRKKPRITDGGLSTGSFAQTGNELSRSKRTFGRYPRMTAKRQRKLLGLTTSQQVMRFQGVTNFDTNVGYFPLANRTNTDTSVRFMPVHIYNLTDFALGGIIPMAGLQMYWDNTSGTAQALGRYLNGQNSTGLPNNNGEYWLTRIGRAPDNPERVMHDWVSVKLNLYGARKRGTTFYIEFVRFKDHNASLWVAGGSNALKMDMLDNLTGNLVYSNLMSRAPEARKNLQVVKRYKYYVPGGSADDLDTIGKVKEVRIFIRQGRIYNLNFRDREGQGHAQQDGDDYDVSNIVDTHPVDRARMYMIIRAFSPEERANSVTGWATTGRPGDLNWADITTAADPMTEPSYDIILENAYSFDNA